MHPVLFSIGRYEFRTYGILLFISYGAAVYYALKRAEKYNINKKDILKLSLLLLATAFWGSRIFYAMILFHKFKGNIQNIFNPFYNSDFFGFSGFGIMGGFLSSLVFGIVYLKWRRISFLRVADLLSPPGALIIGIARIGCFSAGCCYGIPTSLPIVIKFPEFSPAGISFTNMRIHPTQLYSSIAGFIILFILSLGTMKRILQKYYYDL